MRAGETNQLGKQTLITPAQNLLVTISSVRPGGSPIQEGERQGGGDGMGGWEVGIPVIEMKNTKFAFHGF